MRRISVLAFPRQAWLSFLVILKRSVVSAYRDNALGIAKGAAYSGLLAFFPVLTTLATILAQARAEALGRTLARTLEQVMPPEIAPLIVERFIVRGEKPVYLLVAATLLALWAASGLTTSLMDGFQAAYRVPRRRGTVRHRVVAILLVFAAVIPAVGASSLMLFGGRAEQYVLGNLGVVAPAGETLRGGVVVVSRVVRYVIAVGAVVLVTALLYHYGPDRRRKFRETWAGAMLATALWWLATAAFAWYVRNIANYSVMYGSVGAAIALLVWIYLLAIIALLGCEFNAELDRLRERFRQQR
ncbi:MAG: YihY/virulence factor BrkB family protein [Acidobacteria bacterium]|nr:YihY/virulence factor BrkB family protein [Acidobacteriota bacterium]